ncbi:hypothetical protein CETAM_09200 [Corynebacterium comes]|uniref:Uncharacterized protein n=1 Tax=Corynebacterium comes TaxID=2675218 RepID=A0A6B8VM27_9CORY|nr:hypothetical protein CETAM_09200 [Corynebacterium comes]
MRKVIETVPTTVETDSDLLGPSLETLAAYDFRPSAGISVGDLDADAFRRRPLTTLLTHLDEDGHPVFGRVYIDQDELTRTTVADLTCFATTVAGHAGTGGEMTEPIVMTDPGSPTTGSLRYTVGQTVRDHSFHIDPDFGDGLVEADILEGVAPEGYDAFTFYAGPAMKPVTIWLPADSDDKLIEALVAENPEPRATE